MKKKIFLPLLLLLALVIAACSSGSDNQDAPADTDAGEETTDDSTDSEATDESDVITLQIGTISPPEHSYSKGVELFAEKVEEATDGRVNFEIFLDGQLGGEREIVEQVQLGSLDLTLATAGVVGSFVPELSVLEMPFLFESVDKAYEVLDGDVGAELEEKIEAQGFKSFGIMENGKIGRA